MSKTNREKAIALGIDEKNIKRIGNTDCVLFADLLDLAHKKSFKGFKPPTIHHLDCAKHECVVIACAMFENGAEYGAIGHTSESNMGGLSFPEHYVVIAETRAQARALRNALNIPLVSREELTMAGDSAEVETISKPAGDEITEKQGKCIRKQLESLNKDTSYLSSAFKKFNVTNLDDLTSSQANTIIKSLNSRIEKIKE